MTAFLLIPASVGSDSRRRVDFARMASLFSEVEEPAPRSGPSRTMLRVVAAALLVLLAVGDTLLMARPGTLACPSMPRPTPTRAMF